MYDFRNSGFPILTVLTFPVGGRRAGHATDARQAEGVQGRRPKAATAANFILSLVLIAYFDRYTADDAVHRRCPGSRSLGIAITPERRRHQRAADHADTLLSLIIIPASWNYVKEREMQFFVAFLFLETGLIGVFCARTCCCSMSSGRSC